MMMTMVPTQNVVEMTGHSTGHTTGPGESSGPTSDGSQGAMLHPGSSQVSWKARVGAAVADAAPSLVLFTIAMLGRLVDPYVRPVSDYANGPPISLSNDEELVSTGLAILYSYVLPMVLILLLCLASKTDWIEALLGLFEVVAFNEFFTTFTKKIAGSLRPSFLAMCQWNGEGCDASNSKAMSSRQSFPSGHASNAFAGLTYLVLVTHLLLSLLRDKHAKWCPPSTVRALSSLPLLLAGWIAVSRTRDYHHRFEDIAAGAAIGAVCACVGFYSRAPALLTSVGGKFWGRLSS